MPRLRGQQRREKQKLKQRRGDEEWEENDAKIWEGAEKRDRRNRESKEQNEANENYSGFKYWKDVQIALMIALNKSTGNTKMIAIILCTTWMPLGWSTQHRMEDTQAGSGQLGDF